MRVNAFRRLISYNSGSRIAMDSALTQHSFPVTRIVRSRIDSVDFDNLGFEDDFSDHMFRCEFRDGQWIEPQIVPYGAFQIYPGALCLHYGQAVFEGLKAFRGIDGNIRVFRPDMNAERLRNSCERLCIPPVDEELFCSAIDELVSLDEKWIPSKRGESLYVRPLIFATEPNLQVKAADRYLFLIITSPVKEYFSERKGGISLRAEPRYTRAAPGGTGFAKTGGNYAGTLRPGEDSIAQGFDQTLWLDGVEHLYVEEVGQMNIFFRIGDTFVTPPLQGTILPGVTRNSVLTLLKDRGEKCEERRIRIEEIIEAHHNGSLTEVFGAGTAAVITPVGRIAYQDEVIDLDADAPELMSKRLYDGIVDIQTGAVEDVHGWNRVVTSSDGAAASAKVV